MKKTATLAGLLLLLFLLPGCIFLSWERKGEYYPPQTAVNTIGIKRVPLAEHPVKDYTLIFSFEYEPRKKHLMRTLRLGEVVLGRKDVGYFTETVYLGKRYYVYKGWGSGFDGLEITPAHAKETTVARFDTPRFITQIAAFQQRFKGRDLLVVYLNQQNLSDSSTLLIFDENFQIVYQDHLLHAREIGRAGDKIVVKSGNFWYPKDDKRVDINGDWVYFIP